MLFSIVLLAVSLSIDALGVGTAYGIRKVHIPFASKLIICFFSILYSCAALAAGRSLSTVLSPAVSKFAGASVLVLMGLWIILQALLKKQAGSPTDIITEIKDKTLLHIAIKSLGITIQVIKNPAKGDIDRSGTIDAAESLLLGLALSVDAIGVGVGSALAGFYSMIIPVFVGLFQLSFLYIGLYLGKRFALSGKISTKLLSVLPGLLLIFLALIKCR